MLETARNVVYIRCVTLGKFLTLNVVLTKHLSELDLISPIRCMHPTLKVKNPSITY